MKKENVLKTVEALIALAVGTSNENEARNAAMQACKLIHEHKLLARRPPAQGFYAPPEEGEWAVQTFDDLMNEVFGNRPRRQEPRAEPPPQPVVQPPAYTPPKDPDAKLIPVMEPAFCAKCGQRILRGKFAYWSRRQLYHQDCWNKEF